MSKRIMILATNGFEQSELEKPRQALLDAGHEVLVVSPETDAIKGWDDKDWGRPVTVDMALEDAKASDFDALVLPGGQMNPDILRMNKGAVDIVLEFCAQNKPVAAICHGPWMLAEAGVLDGRRVTSWPSIRTDLTNAGAEVVDMEVVVDDNFITSRKPDDIPAFNKAILNMLEHDPAVAVAAE